MVSICQPSSGQAVPPIANTAEPVQITSGLFGGGDYFDFDGWHDNARQPVAGRAGQRRMTS